MPLHEWTRVDAGIFHAFHVAWIPELQKVLNNGLLPKGYYALAEQHAGRAIADVLTLHAPVAQEPLPRPPLEDTGGTAVAEAPPKLRRKQTVTPTGLNRRRSLAIRHVSGHRLVALVEILSPSNKDRPSAVADFAFKVVTALEHGIHVVMIDLFPPGSQDPHGMHGAILHQLNEGEEAYEVPVAEPLTLASYVANGAVEIYVEHVCVGAPLPEAPLFLRPDRYVNLPLEATYHEAYRGMPAFWRDALEGRQV